VRENIDVVMMGVSRIAPKGVETAKTETLHHKQQQEG
jgi:hypothetical protein